MKMLFRKKKMWTGLMLLFLISLSVSLPSGAAGLASGYYRIVSAAGKQFCLNIEDGGRENGTNIVLDKTQKTGIDLFRIRKVSGKYYRIESMFSGRALTVSDTNIIQSKWKKKKEQLWRLESAGSGKYFLIAKSGEYLGIENKKAFSGANVSAKAPAKKAWVKWILTPVTQALTVSSSQTTFSSKASATGIVVNAAGSWKAGCSQSWISLKKSGSYLIITCKKNTGEERTAAVKVKSGSLTRTITVTQKSKEDSDGKRSLKNGTYYFISALGKEKYGLTVHDGKGLNGTNAQIDLLDGSSFQQFQLKYVSDGAYAIIAKHSGKCLEVDGATRNIHQWAYKGYNQQLWIPESAGNDFYYLRSVETGLYLSVSQGKAGEGVNVNARKGKSLKSQRWKLTDPKDISVGYKYAWKTCGKADVTDEFLEKTLRISRNLGTDPDDLMSVMAFESSLNHTAVNPKSGATGLIQFLPSTAARLGTSTSSLKSMSAVRQLDYVYSYLSSYTGRLTSIGSLYMAVLWPSAVGQSDSYVIWRKGGTYSLQYSRNSGLDVNKDGAVTVGEAVKTVLACRKRFVGE